jgi:hypothetical protein
VVLGALTTLAALAVRVAAATNEIWLDEVWSLRIAADLPSAWRAFLIRHDNNHVLNTIYLHWVGLRDAWILYRLPSVVAGTATVALVLACERPARRADALAAATLVAWSYPLVLYSAEARGYAPALFFALASFYAVERFWERPRLAPLLAFWVAAGAGTLFHATYVPVYLALLGWSIVRALETQGMSARAMRTLVACHLIPAAIVGAFYLFFVRGMVVGGGPGYRALDVVRETAAYATGVPQAVALALRGSPRWTFFVLVLAVVPATVIAATRPPVLYFRYFLPQILFLYLVVAALVGALARRGALGRATAGILVALYVAAQAVPLYSLVAAGRGGCVETVRYLGAYTDGAEVVVSADEEFRTPLMLWYLERFLPPGQRLRWVDPRAWPAEGPAWVLAHDLGPPTARPAAIQDGHGNRYDRAAGFQCGGVARWHWWIYRRHR